MLLPITPEPMVFVAATRRVEAACANREQPDAARRPGVVHDTFECERPEAREYWRYLEAQNRMDHVELRAMGERGANEEAFAPAVIRAANLGSAKIGDVSPVRAGVSARVVEAYTVSRRTGSGRVMDVMA